MLQINFQKAQGLTEYAFIILLVALIVIIALSLVGPPVGNVFSNVVHNI